MNRGQEARLTSLRRIQVFLDDNAAELGPINKSTSRADLDAAVTGLAKFTAQQAEAEKEMTGRTKEKVAAREELRLEHMQPIAAIARKKLGKTPAIQDLRLPAKNTSDETLVAEGTAMAAAAAKYLQIFLDQQLPKTFIAQLEASVKAVQKAITARSAAALKVNEATKGVKAQLSLTKSDVQVLNGLVVKQLRGNKGLLGAWSNAKRVYAKGGVATGTTRTPVVPPGPTPAPAPVPPTPAPTPAPAPAPAPVTPTTPPTAAGGPTQRAA